MIKRESPHSNSESGAVLAFVASSLVAIMALVALAVDLTLIEIYRLQQQSAADFYAIAAARALAKAEAVPSASYDFFATDNKHIFQSGADTPALRLGMIDPSTGGFVETGANLNAAQVILTNSGRAGLTVVFAKVFGADLATTQSTATAYFQVVGTETVFRLL